MADAETNIDKPQQEEKLQCTVTIDDNGPWKKKISVLIPRLEIDKELDKQYGELRHSADIPGFRKGRAPRRLIEKRFGDDVSERTKLGLLAQALEQIEGEQDFEVLGEPDFDPTKIELPDTGDLKFEYEVEVKPKFDLPPLEGVRVEKQILEINEERINEALEQLRQRYGRLDDITDEPARENDFLRADITMKLADVDEPEKMDDFPLSVGSEEISGIPIEGLAKLLTGVKIGEVKTCAARIPEEYPKKDYHGKEAEFSIRVKTIRRFHPADLNEEFFAALGVEDEADLKKRIADNLENQADREIHKLMANQVYSYLDKNVAFELPAGVAARHADSLLARRYYELLRDGVPEGKINENIEQLKASTSKQAAGQLKMSFIMEKVSEKLDLTVTDEEINGAIAQFAAMHRRRPERVREEMQRQGRLDELQNMIRDEKAVDRILEMAAVVDAPVKKESAKPKKQAAKKTETQPEAKPESKTESKTEAETKTAKPKKRSQVVRKPPKAKGKETES